MEKLSIAMVSPYDFSHPSGVNTHAVNLSRYLASQGHCIDLLGPCSDSYYEHDAYEGISFHSLGSTIPFPISSTAARISLNPKVYFQIRSILKNQFDIVHIHEPFMPLTSLSTLLLSKCPKIGTFHAYHEYKNNYAILQSVVSPLMNLIDHAICVSEASKSYIQPWMHNFTGNVSVIGNGIDTSKFKNSIKPYINNTPFTVVFIGRDEPRKGLTLLLKALENLSYSNYKFKLLVAGLNDLNSYNNLFPNIFKSFEIECLGSVHNDLIPNILQTSDVVCVPSLGGESFGIVLLEALASNTPVIASDIKGYSQILSQQNYPLIPVNDASALEHALESLILNPELRHNMAELGTEIVRKYNWTVIGSEIESIYWNMCGR